MKFTMDVEFKVLTGGCYLGHGGITMSDFDFMLLLCVLKSLD